MPETSYLLIARHLIKTYRRTLVETPVCFLAIEKLAPRVQNELRKGIAALGFTVLDGREAHSNYGYFHPRKSKAHGFILSFDPEVKKASGQLEVKVSIDFGIRAGYGLRYVLEQQKNGWQLVTHRIMFRH